MSKKGQLKVEHKYLKNAFDNFYTIPTYQRGYVWKKRQVEQLMEDLKKSFLMKEEHFLGQVIVYENKNTDGTSSYELIDGQQRFTTLYLLICIIYEFYKKNNISSYHALESMIRHSDINSEGDEFSKYRLELSWLKNKPNNTDETSFIPFIFKNESDLKGSDKRIYEAYEYIYSYMENNFDNIVDIKKFFGHLLSNINYIQIEALNIRKVLDIFETINERGVGLNPMDLLKNLLCKHLKREEFEKLDMKWSDMTDMLNSHNINQIEFLRHFIMSKYDVKEKILRKKEIYEWILDNRKQCGYDKNTFLFMDTLLDNAKIYIKFYKGLDINGNKNECLDNILKLGGKTFRQHFIILLSAKHLDNKLFEHLAKQIEKLLFYFIINRIPTTRLEPIFANWTSDIRKLKTKDELNNFIEKNIKGQIHKKEKEQYKFKENFLLLNENFGKNGKAITKYTLAKIAQYVDKQKSNNTKSNNLDHYYSCHIEHILPQKPSNKLLETMGMSQDDYDIIKLKLGNLTFLETNINTSIGNNTFEKKIEGYSTSSIYLTKSIHSLDNFISGQNTSINKLNNKLKSFNRWDLHTINERQKMLYDISKDMWKIETI